MKRRIISGELIPGLSINEDTFAKDLGVSKTPIREALRQLEKDGLVENIPGRGTRVCDITTKYIAETFEIREIIECGAAKRASFLKDKDILFKKINELKLLKDSDKINSKDIYKSDFFDDIHHSIVYSLKNQKLNDLYKNLQERIERIRNLFEEHFDGDRFKEILDEHIKILDAIIAGDSVNAEKMVEDHLKNALHYIINLALSNRI